MNERPQAAAGRFTRRAWLLRLGGFMAAALAASGWRAHTGPAGVATDAVACVLTPEQTEGPYYIQKERLRRTISEGRPGTPLTLRLKVVDVSTCKPIKGAAVDVWHCDARGVYSGFGPGAGSRTFMRGIQRTDARGIATFRTIYPGWYPGRTVHIHVKVHVGGSVVHTGQLYFPDALTDAVYEQAPYAQRGTRNTRNATDFVFRNGGRRSLLRVRKNRAGGYLGSITMGVSR